MWLSARRAAVICFAVLLALAAGVRSPGPARAAIVALDQIAGGLTNPNGIVNAGDGSDRLFIVEQSGYIRVYSGSPVPLPVFLDVHTLVATEFEQGLLGLYSTPPTKRMAASTSITQTWRVRL